MPDGMRETIIQNLPLSDEPPPEGEVCAFCLERDGEDPWRVLPCEHRFHSKCVDEWLRNHGTCPICRQNAVSARAEAQQSEPSHDSSANAGVQAAAGAGGTMTERGTITDTWTLDVGAGGALPREPSEDEGAGPEVERESSPVAEEAGAGDEWRLQQLRCAEQNGEGEGGGVALSDSGAALDSGACESDLAAPERGSSEEEEQEQEDTGREGTALEIREAMTPGVAQSARLGEACSQS